MNVLVNDAQNAQKTQQIFKHIWKAVVFSLIVV